MSRRERETRVPLDGLSEEQLSILREEAADWLVAAADDLEPHGGREEAKRAVKEVAALGRLNSSLRSSEVRVPDRVVMELVARRTTETRHLDELKEEYDRELAEHEAWSVLLAYIAKGRRP
jgi:hypothetical protein